jgi:hypothetical protein
MKYILLFVIFQLWGCGKDLDRDTDSLAPLAKDVQSNLACEAWHQLKDDELQKQNLKLQSRDVNNTVLTTSFKGYTFRVDWDKNLTTLYMNVKKNGESILFSTSRVPTEDHNDSFLDGILTDGSRIAISCMHQEEK